MLLIPCRGRWVRVHGGYGRSVCCFNEATGEKAWSWIVDGGPYSSRGSIDLGPSSPAVANGFVFVGDWDQSFYCLNATTGIEVWNYTTGDPVTSSPAVAMGCVFVGCVNKNVYCLPMDLLIPSSPRHVQATPGYMQFTITWQAPAAIDGVPVTGTGSSGAIPPEKRCSWQTLAMSRPSFTICLYGTIPCTFTRSAP